MTGPNRPPSPPPQPPPPMPESSDLVVPTTATDSDLPANNLTYSLLVTSTNPGLYTLLSGPTNATISANGIITWTPTEAQGPSTNIFTTVVTDNGSPPLSATNTFTVVVTEINSAPILPAQLDQTIAELTELD